MAYGPLAVPLLREAVQGPDLELVRRAEDCLRQLAKQTGHGLPTAAPRLVALHNPPGAVRALLDYLPFADNETMSAEIQTALIALAMKDGKPDAILLEALSDKHPLRRSAAAEALARAGGPRERKLVSKLLKDTDLTVRTHAALALARAQEKAAVPVLIDLLADLPTESAWPVVDFLYLAAGDKAPKLERGKEPVEHKKYRDAWAAWWKENGDSLDLARLEGAPPLLGYTLVVDIGNGNPAGRVIELGRDGKPRWMIDKLNSPVDAYVLRENRVLITEGGGQAITERDFSGKIIWQKQGLGSYAINAQRLPNGNTFIATQNELLEVDREGKTVFSQTMPNGVLAAAKAHNGNILYLTNQNPVLCVRLDANGKELGSFPAHRTNGYTSGIALIPNGHILIAQPDRNMVTEYDAGGKKVWEASAPGVTTATRLPNGHTLVAGHDTANVVELDRTGKTVWEYKDDARPFRARRR